MNDSCKVMARLINYEHLLVKSVHKRDFVSTGNKTKAVVALFTTKWARLKLHQEVLDKLQERVYYCDTDSTIFQFDSNGWNPPKGDYLGDLTSELQPGRHISEFVSSGAKNYSCKLINSETDKHVVNITKDWGLSVKMLSAKKVVNHDVMVDLVLSKEQLRANGLSGKKIYVPFFYISRNYGFNIHSHIVRKTYSLVFDKRVLKVNKGYKTYPYSYKKPA